MDKVDKIAKGKTPRRRFLKVLWAGLGLVALGELVLMVISFFRPVSKKEDPVAADRLIDAGSIDTYEPGTVAAFVRGQFYLVCFDNGGFLAVSGKCTHLGCAVPWDKEQQKFVCPCHASEFDISGNVLSSPAPRALDLFKINIVNNNIYVDVGSRIKRNRFDKSQLVYPETVTLMEESRKTE